MGMQMWFYNGIQVTLWFEGWTTQTLNNYLLGCLGLALFACVHEFLSFHRAQYVARVFESARVNAEGQALSKRRTLPAMSKAALGALYVANTLTAYLLMLAVMTYNVGYCLSVILGLGTGYVLFLDAGSLASAAKSADSCHGVRLVDGS
ncbi:hypothetical protein FOA52_012895 [Chlamydomonas sp. UWO 241]|nr:hypothetical protein FOA52_012895 [Chlamydomonas sp. UWO 241]